MKKSAVFLFAVCFPLLASAADNPTISPKPKPVQLSADTPDALLITQRGTRTGATACIGCHGGAGEGRSQTDYPRLAGLPSPYIASQLENFANGSRVNSVMGPIAKALTGQERSALADYYSSLQVSKNLIPPRKSALVTEGRILASLGNQKLQVQACENCHGPGGAGLWPVPALSGQPALYIKTQLLAWKNSQRKSSPEQMLQIAQRLDDKSMAAVGAYFEQVATH